MAKRHDDNAVSQKTSSVCVMSVNRQHKDIFLKEVYAAEKRQRELASFLLGLDVKQVSTANIRPVLFGNKENDLDFTCDDIVYVMTECQAKVFPNITYRLSEYIITGLRAMADSEGLLYGSSRVYFPIPKLYVLQVGLETRESRLPDRVMYDMRLSESYRPSKGAYEKQGITADLEATVHIYDFRMTLAEICQYIEDASILARFSVSVLCTIFFGSIFIKSFVAGCFIFGIFNKIIAAGSFCRQKKHFYFVHIANKTYKT